MLLHREKRRRLFQRPPQQENKGDDEATDEERNAPAPCRDCIRGDQFTQHEPDDGGDENGDLLAGGLERRVESAVAGRRYLGEIDRYAAEFDAGGLTLQ